jgi:arylsulfatase A-like enzyme
MKQPNILFILLDGSRFDKLDTSLDFMELTKQGTLFTNVTTAYPYTFASINAIFTGMFGKENGVDAYYKMFKLKNNISFLPEILQHSGYFTACDLISDKVISKRGFNIYQSHDEYKDNLFEKHPQFLKQIFSNSKEKPIFAFLQFSRIHTVTVSEILKNFEWNDQNFYNQKKKNMETYVDAFKEAGSYAKKIYETLSELNKLDNTILIFFTDHGTGIGERFGERNYGVFTYEETIRTFYLMIGNIFKKDLVVDKLFSSIQLFPTLLEIANVPNIDLENSLITCMHHTHDDVSPFSFSETGGLQGPFPSPLKPNVFCIKSSKHKLIYFKQTNEWKFFNLFNDPCETKNLSEKGIPEEKFLKEKLLNWINR